MSLIFMLAPAPNMVFGGAPSGNIYESNQYALIYVNSAADQVFLEGAGCQPLTPFGSYTPPALSAWKLNSNGHSLPNVSDLTNAAYVNKTAMSVVRRTTVSGLSGTVKVVYSNWAHNSSTGDYYDTGLLGYGTVTGTCSIAYPNKSNVIGTGAFTMQPGLDAQVVMSLTGVIPAGAPYWIGSFGVPAAGCGIPMMTMQYDQSLNSAAQFSCNVNAGEGGYFATTGVTDQTANLASLPVTNVAVFAPTAVLSLQPASTPVIVVNSDSREAGYYIQPDSVGNVGWVAQAFGSTIAVMNMSCSAKGAAVDAGLIISPCPQAGQSAMTLRMRFAQMIGATDGILDLAVNDMGDVGPISGSDTAAQVEGFWATIIGRMQAAGLRVTGVTITPTTTSSDGWVTTSNQTVSPNNTQIDLFNAYVRAKPSGVSFVIDAGLAVGTGLTSAKWNVGAGGSAPWTADGVHPFDRALGNLIGAVQVSNYAAVLPATGLGYADTYGRGLKNVQGALDFLLNPANLGHEILLGTLTGANFNSTADQAISLSGPADYVVSSIVIKGASTSLTTAKGALYSAASKSGPLFGMTTTTPFTALTGGSSATIFGAGSGNATIDLSGSATVYLSLTTPQGGAATGNIYVFGKRTAA